MFTMIIVRIGLGIAIQDMSAQTLSTINASPVRPIAVRMTRFQTATDDLDQAVDVHGLEPMSGIDVQKSNDPSKDDIDDDYAKVTESNGVLTV